MKRFFNAVAGFFSPDPNRINGNGFTRLQQAVIDNDIAAVSQLIKDKADINYAGRAAYPPLHMALNKDRHGIALLLIDSGADINLQDTFGRTPLHRAVSQSQEYLVRALLKRGADPNVRDNEGKSPLHLVSTARPEIVDLLAARGAHLDARDKQGETPLHLFIDKPAIAERLVFNGADPNVRDDKGVSAYMLMLEDDRIGRYPRLLQQLVSHKADLSSINKDGKTVLHLTAELDMPDTFAEALKRGDLAAKDGAGNNVLHALTVSQNPRMLAAALAKAPELLKEKNAAGLTPLGTLVAQAQPRFGLVDPARVEAAAVLMIEAGSDPSETDGWGRSLLHYAVKNERAAFVEYLLEKGVKTDLLDSDGQAALHLAVDKKNMDILDRLLDAGANPDLTDARGWTLLDHLAEKDDRTSPVVQRLIVAGGSYKKQLPLNPDQMRHRPRPGLDKGKFGGLGMP